MKKSCTTKTPQSIMKKTDREGENVMQALFDAVNAICGKIQVVSDLSDQLRLVCGDPDSWEFQSGDHFAGRYWNFSDISVPVCTGAEI